MAVSIGFAMKGENTVCLLLQLACQPGENKRVCNFYATLCSKQELTTHNAFQCYLVTYPPLPSLTPEPMPRG